MEKDFNIISVFESIDGEVNSAHQGVLTTFIRFARCNLRCTWCDTTYSFGEGTKITLTALLNSVYALKPKKVTLTGGEPLLQANILELIDKLLQMDYTVSVETNGTLAKYMDHPKLSWVFDYKLPSSGMESFMILDNFKNLNPNDWVKFVIADDEDFHKALQMRKVLDSCGCSARYAYSPIPGYPADVLVSNLLKSGEGDEVVSMQLHKIIWPNLGKNEEH